MKLKDWLVKNGVQEERAETVTKIYRSLAVLTYREEVIASLTKILEKNNKKVRDEYVAALADVMMSRKKWSAMRLRDLYEGPGLYTALAALHAAAVFVGLFSDSFRNIRPEPWPSTLPLAPAISASSGKPALSALEN